MRPIAMLSLLLLFWATPGPNRQQPAAGNPPAQAPTEPVTIRVDTASRIGPM